MCEITNYSSTDPIYAFIDKYIISLNDTDLYTFDKYKNTKVFVNGNWVGYTTLGDKLTKDFKNARGNGHITHHTSIYWNILENTVYIYSDEGRCTRPFSR